jgi:hypothetical protein
VAEFLAFYQNRRCSIQCSDFTATLTEDEIVGILTFHVYVVDPLIWKYTSWTLSNLSDRTEEESEETKGDRRLSETEQTRLLRAFYRFQLCCNLFGMGRPKTARRRMESNFDSLNILKSFFCLFEPWEVGEIACIYTFAKEMYIQISDDIRWDVDQDNPKFAYDPRPPTPTGAFNLDCECECLPLSFEIASFQTHEH